MKFAATTGKTAIQDVSPGSSPSFARAEGDGARSVPPEGTLPVPADGISELFQTYVQPIYRYCYGRLGSREAAEDATSQTFVNALQGIAGRRGDGPGAWLFAIARRVTADEIRKPKALAETPGEVLAVDPGKGPEELVLDEFERAAVREALARLPSDQCIAIEMYIAGWSLAETAQVLKRSTPAVKMLRRRGLARLRESWGRNAERRPRERRNHTNTEGEE